MSTNPQLETAVTRTKRVLLLEDNQRDAEHVQQCVQASKNETVIDLSWERTLKSGLKRLRAGKYAAVLLDLCLPDSTDGVDTLRAIVNFDKNLPVEENYFYKIEIPATEESFGPLQVRPPFSLPTT